MSFSAVDSMAPRAVNVAVDDRWLTVELADGRTLRVPLEWYPRLCHGTPQERANWRLIGGGEGIHWEALDEDISIAGLLAGKPSAETRASLERWLAKRSSMENPG